MPCSVCHSVGHNFRTCPELSQEQREEIIKKNKKKKEDAIKKRKEREEREENKRKLVERVSIEVSNLNEYEVVVYWGFKYLPDQNIHDKLIRLVSIGPCESNTIKVVKDLHRIAVFPIFEVVGESGIGVEHIINGEFTGDKVKNIDINLVDHLDGSIVVPKKEYKPPKNELDKWKEFGLKSNFILKEIEKLSTRTDKDGIKIAHEKYDNIAPFIEMIQDIREPECSEIDREFAGVPSKLTNIT